jgi:hypothetical protein
MLTVIYRACHLEQSSETYNVVRPQWFDKKKCFKSLYDEFGRKSKIVVVWDGDAGLLLDYITGFKVDIIERNYKSNKESLLYCYNLAEQFKTDIFFAEDDYLFLPGCREIMEEGIARFGIMTCYDSIDRYNFIGKTDLTFGQEHITIGSQCHFRTAESTTGSIGFSYEKYLRLKSDLIHFNVNDRPFYRHILTKGFRLFSSIPGYMTHVNNDTFGALYDWEKFNNSIIL